MIHYIKCSDATTSLVYEGFQNGFSDYLIPMTLQESEFISHFFGPEGNNFEHSFLALDDEKPIGVILGGIRDFDGVKTMRCGALCVTADYRGKGVSKRLFEYHCAIAKEEGCKQLVLEVLSENFRAISFYEKSGYRKSTLLKHYSKQFDAILLPKTAPAYSIKALEYDVVHSFRKGIAGLHINWQSDTPFYENAKDNAYLGMYDKERLIGIIAMSSKGKIKFIWVEQEYRYKGLGHTLLVEAANRLNVQKVSVTITSNGILEGFFRKFKFEKGPIEQYEMYQPL